MATWIEFRCEARTQEFAGTSEEGAYQARCLSHHNAGPQDMALDTRASVIDLLQTLEREAKEAGWVKTKVGWVCPGCAKYMREHNIPSSSLDD